MENIMKDFEHAKMEEHKKMYLDAQKKANHEVLQSLTKTALKKYEKNTMNGWQLINSSSGQSLSLDSAIMYMQNVLS